MGAEVLATDTGRLVELGVAALAVGLGALLGITKLLVEWRRSRRRRAAPRGMAESPLSRLEHLPAVTSRAARLNWQGSRYWTIGPRLAKQREEGVRELIGSPAQAAVCAPAGVANGGGGEAVGLGAEADARG